MLTCTLDSPARASLSASFSRIMNALVFTFTLNIRARACARMSKKSIRISTSPPLIVRKNTPGLGHLVEHIPNLGQRHLAVIVMVQIAMHAALVTAIRDVQL